MKVIIGALALCALVACGVDGDPVQPSGGVNVTLDNSGAEVGGSVELRRGAVVTGTGF